MGYDCVGEHGPTVKSVSFCLVWAAAVFMAEIIDLFCICCCLMIGLLLFLATTPGMDIVGGQVCTDVTDSSDSVTEGVDRFRFNGISAADAFVAALRFGLLGGSAITIEVDGISIGNAKSFLICVGCFGGAVVIDLFGLVGIRTR